MHFPVDFGRRNIIIQYGKLTRYITKLRLRLGQLSYCFIKLLFSTKIKFFGLESCFIKQQESRPKRNLNSMIQTKIF
ncbi:hypothetical protein KFK09_018672 [Dendrobium nobile]|uniref:Uncharacterized protein n=1 Tax=Dendrobium nobile TaxID=94219 RepID=A0A8T3AWE8_DENNO|nr:hypothetical protein KFK09_018672 [Dendrobium nobile]